MKSPLSDQRIIDYLKAYYGLEAVTLRFLPLGADMNASVYKAETKEQQFYFVKLKRHHQPDMSIAIMELLQNAKIQQIIPPIETIHGQPTQHIGDFTLIVYPFVEGQDGFSRSLTDEQWLILGKTLRQIHEIDVPSSLQHHIRRESYSPKLPQAVFRRKAKDSMDKNMASITVEPATIARPDAKAPLACSWRYAPSAPPTRRLLP